MAESFNLNSYLQSYQKTNYDPTKQHAAAEAKMEEKLQQQAAEAVQGEQRQPDRWMPPHACANPRLLRDVQYLPGSH